MRTSAAISGGVDSLTYILGHLSNAASIDVVKRAVEICPTKLCDMFTYDAFMAYGV